MNEIVQNTIKQIEGLKVGDLYKYSKDKDIFCIHINSIVNFGLAELGYTEEVSKNVEWIIKSRLYSEEYSLFYREINSKGEIVNEYLNTCKNALAAIALIANGSKQMAEGLVDSMYRSLLFDKRVNLFCREFKPSDSTIKPLIITQSNLWLAVALVRLQRFSEAKKILLALESLNFDKEIGLFMSQDCERVIVKNDYEIASIEKEKVEFFSDDQALAVIVYKMLKEDSKAKLILDTLLRSKLYDKETGLVSRNYNQTGVNNSKTSYKNGIMGIAFGMMGYNDELNKLNESMYNLLYDKKESLFNFSDSDATKIPDNSMLALLSINYNNLKHVIF